MAIPAGTKGDCFANANKFNARYGRKTDLVVHGLVTSGSGKRFPHAWIERGNTVLDPTSGAELPREKYYALLDAAPTGKYTSTEAIRNQIKSGHHGPWTKQDLGESTMGTTNCGICGKPVMDDDGPIGDVVDAFKYDYQGYLDYINLFHRRCAISKGYKIGADGHVIGAGPRGRDVHEHIVKQGSGYRLVSHKGKNLGDFSSKAAAAKHEGEVEWFKKHKTESVNESYGICAECGAVLETADDEYGGLCADCARQDESQQTATYSQVNEMTPEQGEDMREDFESDAKKRGLTLDRQTGANKFHFKDKEGQRHLYDRASNTWKGPKQKVKEMSDAAPAIARTEGAVIKRFGKTILEMQHPDAPPMKRKIQEAHGPIEWAQLTTKANKEWGIDLKDVDIEGLKFELKTARRFKEPIILLPMVRSFKGSLPRIPIEDAENIVKNHQGFIRGMRAYNNKMGGY